jgi:hypothetical protein
MDLKGAADWIAWAGVVLPLAALAWSAVFYVRTKRREISHQEYSRFFEVMGHLGHQGGSIASKMAAAYELRRFPEYHEVILRLCEQASFEGPASEMLRKEMLLTADVLRKGMQI